MLDTTRIFQAQVLAALTAATGLLLCAWPWQTTSTRRLSVGSVLGVGVSFFVGCWSLGLWPRWPPMVDQARLVFVLFPALIIVELAAAMAERHRWLVWLLRLIIATSAARILLHDSTYLKKETEEFDTGTWTATQAALILAALAVGLASVWAALIVLVRRTPGRSVPLAVAVACAGAAITIMYSSSLTGGQIGLPLAAGLVGVLLASLAVSGFAYVEGMVSLGVVGLFALLVGGRFFGELATSHALLLFLAPLCCWLAEMPYLCRLQPSLRGALRVALTAVPVGIALTLARDNYLEKDSGRNNTVMTRTQ